MKKLVETLREELKRQGMEIPEEELEVAVAENSDNDFDAAADAEAYEFDECHCGGLGCPSCGH